MDAKQFLAEFGHIANAPGGIARLRELVYQFAITGRLTLQREEDGSADDVITNVARIRQRLIAEKKFKRSPKLESALLTPPTIDLPLSWRWSRLLDLGEINPRNQVEEDTELVVMATFVPMAAVSELHSVPIAGEIRPWAEISKGYTHFANGDVLLAKITPCFENGKSAVVQGLEHNIGAGSTEFHVFRPISKDVNPAYVYLFVRSLLFRVKGEASMTGTAGQKRLPTEYFALCAMPLPPSEEQSRIVAKVDELMALCDQLEAQQQKRRTLQNQLRQATLQAVAANQSPQELKESWQRLQSNFGQLFSAPEDVAALRTLILNLGMMGLIVEQQKTDTPVENLIAAIDSERQALISSKKLKPNVPLVMPQEDDLPYKLPKGWKWLRVMDLVDVGTGATPAKTENSYYGGNTPWYTSSATNQKFARLPETFITEKALKETNCKIFPSGSLIVAMYGQGKTRGQISEITVPGATNQAIAALVFFESSLRTKRFIKYFFEKIYDEIRQQAEGGPQPNLNVRKIKETLIPVPPIEEQERIVNRLNELMITCEQLEDSLKKANKYSERLATASVASLTGIAIEQEEEPMKAPQTELVAPVRLGTPPDVKTQAPLATILARHNGEMSAKDLWQRFGGNIDVFYAQLKTEVAHGWILEPKPAEMLEKLDS
jgi:type I restriction enzyme S subunit